MIQIIVAFPKQETARMIKKILVQNGFQVEAVCTTGAQALQNADDRNGGIIVCGYRFADMIYEELYHDLPPNFQMLLVASPANCKNREIENLICLPMPLKANELAATVRMMEGALLRERKKAKARTRSKEEEAMICEAKSLLMERNNLSEEEAHRYLQKRSMENGIGLVEEAQMILSLML